MAILSATKAITSAIIKIIPSYVAIPSATMAITSVISQCGYSICHFGNNNCQSPNLVVATSATVAFHLPQINIIQWHNIYHNLWHNICQTIMTITSAFKFNLKLVVYKKFHDTQTPIHLGVNLQSIIFFLHT